jgi:hypothetical protein
VFRNEIEKFGGKRDADVSSAIYVFTSEKGRIIGMMLVYVDDYLFAGERAWMTKNERILKSVVTVKFMRSLSAGAEKILGMNIAVKVVGKDSKDGTVRKVFLDSRQFMTFMAKECELKDSSRKRVDRPMSDPMPTSTKGGVVPSGIPDAATHACRALYGVRLAGPTETFAVAHLSRHLLYWSKEDDEALARFMAYAEKDDTVMMYHVDVRDLKNDTLYVCTFLDGSCADDPEDRKSTAGVASFVIGEYGTFGCVAWRSKSQPGWADSTAASELASMKVGVKVHLKVLALVELMCGKTVKSRIYSDANAAIGVVMAGYSEQMKHLRKSLGVSIAWLSDVVKKVTTDRRIDKVDTEANVSDVLTKVLGQVAFLRHKRYCLKVPADEAEWPRCRCEECACIVLGKGRCNTGTKNGGGLCDDCMTGCRCGCRNGDVNKKTTPPTVTSKADGSWHARAAGVTA